jgi:hypothetical protein
MKSNAGGNSLTERKAHRVSFSMPRRTSLQDSSGCSFFVFLFTFIFVFAASGQLSLRPLVDTNAPLTQEDLRILYLGPRRLDGPTVEGAREMQARARTSQEATNRDWLLRMPLPRTGGIKTNFFGADATLLIVPGDKSMHLFVKLEKAKSGKLVASMFIRAGDSFEMSLPPGKYKIKIARGTTWFGESTAFGADGIYSAIRSTYQIKPFTRHRIQLEPSPNGTLQADNLKLDQF